MDEPSEGLAAPVVRGIGDLVARLRREHGISILLAEQNVALAQDVADRVCVLDRGELVHQTAAAEFAADRVAQRRFLGVGPRLRAVSFCAAETDAANAQNPSLVAECDT